MEVLLEVKVWEKGGFQETKRGGLRGGKRVFWKIFDKDGLCFGKMKEIGRKWREREGRGSVVGGLEIVRGASDLSLSHGLWKTRVSVTAIKKKHKKMLKKNATSSSFLL